MQFSRREFGKMALATAPAVVLAENPLFGAVQARPNSVFNGVKVGTITYSYRSMPDQSAEATLRYLVESGISQVELMGGPIESYGGIPTQQAAARGGGAGGAGGAGGRAGGGGRGGPDPATLTASWNGVPCAPANVGGGRAAGAPAAPAAAAAPARGAAPAAGPAPAPGGGGGGRGAQTPEQVAFADSVRKWRTSVSMDKFKALRTMYNNAGVTIYATKMLGTNMSDEEMEYVFNVAEALGATHTTLELPTNAAALKRVGDYAMKRKIYASYHTHLQGNISAFDEAFAISPGNTANVDFGHYVAAGSGDPVAFLNKFASRITSFHLKDRTTPANCAQNLAWGTGETPIRNILQAVKKNGYQMPATIELEYAVPEGSDAVKEVAKCVQYCRLALA